MLEERKVNADACLAGFIKNGPTELDFLFAWVPGEWLSSGWSAF